MIARLRLIVLFILFFAVRLSAQEQLADSIQMGLSAATYAVSAEVAEPLLRSAILYRSHLGMWPVELADVSEFLRVNTKKPPPSTWGPCTLDGELDGCMITVRIRPGGETSYFLSDSMRIRRSEARLYVTAPVGQQQKLRALVTGELVSGELLTIEGKLIELKPFLPPPREFITASSAADSVLYVR